MYNITDAVLCVPARKQADADGAAR